MSATKAAAAFASTAGRWKLADRHHFQQNHARVVSCSIARNHSKDGEGAEEGEAGTDGLLLAVGFTNGVFSLNQLVPTFQEIHSLSISQVRSPLLAPFTASATLQLPG